MITGMSWTKHRSRIGLATLNGDIEEADRARRDFAAARLELHIREAITEPHAITDEHRAELAAILTGAP